MNTLFNVSIRSSYYFSQHEMQNDVASRECDDVNTVETWLNPQYPILGNFDLPVEIEGTPKPSRLGNLTREGWGEDGMDIYSLPCYPARRLTLQRLPRLSGETSRPHSSQLQSW